MGLFGRKTKSESATPNGTGPIRLAEAAVACLQRAVTVQLDNLDLLVEERVIWQPDSWLLQRIGQVLAEGGAGEAALAVAQMVEGRVPLARAHALKGNGKAALRYLRELEKAGALEKADVAAREFDAMREQAEFKKLKPR